MKSIEGESAEMAARFANRGKFALVSINSRTVTDTDLASLQEMAVDLLDLLKRNLGVVRREVASGTLIKHTASCTKSVKLSCGATLIIPAVRVQSTRPHQISGRLYQQ